METNMPFGSWLRGRRRDLDLTQEALAVRASCSIDMIKKIEAGRARPSRQLSMILARSLDIPADQQAGFVQWSRQATAETPAVQQAAVAANGTSAQTPGNLPLPLTTLVGRAQEVAAAAALLRGDEARLLTFTGTGGTGKTRLSIEVAAQLRDDFPDGVFFVPLAPVSDPDLVAPAIAQVLGVREGASRSTVDAVNEFLRERKALLVLDNFEQVLAAAPLLAGLLAAPALKIIVSSRAVLHVPGEYEFPVAPLPLPQSTNLSPDELAQNESVDLFVRRARQIRADFMLNEGNASAVAEIARRLDGLPLALELAAAWIKVLPPAALLERLQVRLDLLSGGAPGARWALPERQQTLRGAIGWSYDLLEPVEQALFRKLAVFAGGCTLEGAEAVGRGSAVLDLLAALVDKSLVLQAEQKDGTPRFLMLETIREYACEALEAAGEEEATREAHLAWSLAWAERARGQMDGPAQAQWLWKLAVEHDNMRSALDWCYKQENSEAGLRLATALGVFWEIHGHWREGSHWLAKMLAIREGDAATDHQLRLRARAQHAYGVLALCLGEAQKATSLFESSLNTAKQLEDSATVSDAVLGFVWATWSRDKLVAARGIVKKHEMYSELAASDPPTTFDVLRHGYLAHSLGHYPTAKNIYHEALEVADKSKSPRAIAEVRVALGHLAVEQGDLQDARENFEKSLALAEEIGDRQTITRATGWLGHVTQLQGDPVRGRELIDRGIALARELGDLWMTAWALGNMAELEAKQANYDRAIELIEEGLSLYEQTRDAKSSSWLLHLRAYIAIMQGAFEQAHSALNRGSAIFEHHGLRWGIAVVHGTQGLLAEARGDLEQAAALFSASLSAKRDMNDQLGMIITVEFLASLSARQGSPERAVRLLAAADAARRKVGAPRPPSQRQYLSAAQALIENSLSREMREVAQAEGMALSLAEASSYALQNTVYAG